MSTMKARMTRVGRQLRTSCQLQQGDYFSKLQMTSNFNLFTLTWSYGPPLGGTGVIFVDYHPRNLKTSLPASASSTHFVLHDEFFPLWNLKFIWKRTGRQIKHTPKYIFHRRNPVKNRSKQKDKDLGSTSQRLISTYTFRQNSFEPSFCIYMHIFIIQYIEE